LVRNGNRSPTNLVVEPKMCGLSPTQSKGGSPKQRNMARYTRLYRALPNPPDRLKEGYRLLSEDPPPAFFVSVAAKRVSFDVSRLDATLARGFVSVDSKLVTGQLEVPNG